jgi:hypothetical protein
MSLDIRAGAIERPGLLRRAGGLPRFRAVPPRDGGDPYPFHPSRVSVGPGEKIGLKDRLERLAGLKVLDGRLVREAGDEDRLERGGLEGRDPRYGDVNIERTIRHAAAGGQGDGGDEAWAEDTPGLHGRRLRPASRRALKVS